MSQTTKKIKVSNNNPFDVGVKVDVGTPKSFTVKSKSFVYLQEDEIMYVDSTSRSFRDGFLRIEDEEVKENMGQIGDNPNDITDDEIEKLLNGHLKTMEKGLKELTALHAKNRVVEKAKTLDLTAGKLKIIKEVLGVDIFAEVSEEIV